jgi:predicted Ser/Thr protein kinase
MSLAPSSRLGPYEILSAIGAGGMGEVYRARDTRLDRTVAIKVLPEHLSSNPQLRERFDREAKAISSLSHPHICPLYDVGHQDGVDFLVMEYLEGETLAHRLKKGPIAAEQVLQYAIQITDALDTAHRHGVIHRDLKPGNVMVTKTGAKLLDFGLAKVRATDAAAGMTALPTQTTPLTGEGTILGTLQYMAPEQLEGAEADARTDIFALGAVIYEMATGRRAFPGKSQASVISAIMTVEPPPVSTLQPLAPAPLDHVVQTCLAKDPDVRWQTAHDVLIELKWIAGSGSRAGTLVPIAAGRKSREVLAWALVTILALAAVGLAVIHFSQKPLEVHPVRFQVAPPEKVTLGWNDTPVVSPDGRRFVFTGTNANGNSQLWIRALDSPAIQPLAGTEGASLPFWSPDSRFVAFFSQGKLKKIEASGGPAEFFAMHRIFQPEVRGVRPALFCSSSRGIWRVFLQVGAKRRRCALWIQRGAKPDLWPGLSFCRTAGTSSTSGTAMTPGRAESTSARSIPRRRSFLFQASQTQSTHRPDF